MRKELRGGASGCDRVACTFNSAYHSTYWMLIAANAHLGRMEEAARLIWRLRRFRQASTIGSASRQRLKADHKDPALRIEVADLRAFGCARLNAGGLDDGSTLLGETSR